MHSHFGVPGTATPHGGESTNQDDTTKDLKQTQTSNHFAPFPEGESNNHDENSRDPKKTQTPNRTTLQGWEEGGYTKRSGGIAPSFQLFSLATRLKMLLGDSLSESELKQVMREAEARREEPQVASF